MSGPQPDPDLVRSYVRTGGRERPSRPGLRLESLVRQGSGPDPGLPPDARRVMDLVGAASGALAVADVAAALDLPPVTALILISDLLDSRHLATPVTARPHQPDTALLEEVLRGLRAKL
ncbi:DUF742 domain-containing protein [Streptomyces sp. NPDC058417]|uniref:DUF742 domain-containing protein n=1 Tax=unclassified Streptomyces TaxID=2593676 RepID=UPI00365877FA